MIKNFFEQYGCVNFGVILNQKKCITLREKIKKLRNLSKNIFYRTEKEFRSKGRYQRYSPGALNHNLLLSEKEYLDLSFIEKSKKFKNAVSSIMGKNYTIMKKSIIRSVPYTFMPKWIKNKLIDIGRPNLNPWIKDQYQDIQYFLNVDFHQDMTRGKKFCTFYIYLDDVSNNGSCLKVLGGSYKLGAQPYPHQLRKSLHYKNTWYYNSDKKVLRAKEQAMTGKAGTAFCFHGLNLHGSYYDYSKDPRISLRYLIAPDKKDKYSVFMQSFKKINGKIVIKDLSRARLDRKKDGSFLPTSMSITK